MARPLAALPNVGRRARRSWRFLKYLGYRGRWRLTSIRNRIAGLHAQGIDVHETHWVAPDRIRHCALHEFNVEDFKGRVLDGDWDRSTKRFDQLDVYFAFEQVLREGREWSETLFHRRIAEALDRGLVLWGCRNREDLDDRCRRLRALAEKIREEGYRPQADLVAEEGVYDPMRAEDEITVSVGRDGELLFSNSAHRLCIARILGVETIPIKVAVRHAEWVRRLKESGGREVF